MAERDPLRADLLRHLAQEGVADASGRLLRREVKLFLPCRYILEGGAARNVETIAERPHVFGVRGRLLAPKSVIKVGGCQGDGPRFAQYIKAVKKRNRVRPAGHRDDHRLPGGEHLVLL